MAEMGEKTIVEVQRDGAWTEAVVFFAYGRGRGRRYKVRYDHHPVSDAQRLTQEEDVPYTRVRPIPPQAPHNYNYSIRHAVEVSDKGCWWPGIITQAMRTNSELFLIYFPHNRIQKMYHYSKLRPAQEWLKGKWCLLPSQVTYLLYFYYLFGCSCTVFSICLLLYWILKVYCLLSLPIQLRPSVKVCRSELRTSLKIFFLPTVISMSKLIILIYYALSTCSCI